jgi:hypothetical protein
MQCWKWKVDAVFVPEYQEENSDDEILTALAAQDLADFIPFHFIPCLLIN